MAAGVAFLYFFLSLPPIRNLRQSRPAASYAEALARLEAWQRAEGSAIRPECRTQLSTHGAPTRRAVVLLHGYTNCPHQFHAFAPLLFERGDNVLAVRLARHGGVEVTGPEMAYLTVEELVTQATEAVDIARGLGEEVIVFGFSLGGVIAAWLAQARVDVALAVIVAAPFGLQAIPRWLERAYARILAQRPNEFRWWDSERREKRAGPRHAYAGFSTRGIAAILRLSTLVCAAARRTPPAARAITVITNPSDQVVRNDVSLDLALEWRRHGGQVHLHELPADWDLIHDLMDPEQPGQQVERVYPWLLARMEPTE